MDCDRLNELKIVLRSLVVSTTKKVTIQSLENDYRDLEGINIPYKQLGFQNLEALLRAIPDALSVCGSGDNAVVKYVPNAKTYHIETLVAEQMQSKRSAKMSRSPVLNKKPNQQRKSNNQICSSSQVNREQLQEYLHDEDEKSNKHDAAVPESALNYSVFLVDFPDGAARSGEKIPSYILPKVSKAGNIYPIVISEIHNPYTFWFRIYEENSALDDIMIGLERFYASAGAKSYCIPPAQISAGQACATLFKGFWQRGEIVSPLSDDKAKIYLVDCGAVAEVCADYIKYLPRIYANIPRQAIRGSLSRIVPQRSYWTDAATKTFVNMVTELILYAKVTEFDEENNVVYMVICKINKTETMQINKMLVNEGFAHVAEWNKSQKGRQQQCNSDGLCSHEMLEQGLYPSFDEHINKKNFTKNTSS